MKENENLKVIEYEKPELLQFDYNRRFIIKGSTSCDNFGVIPPSSGNNCYDTAPGGDEY